MLTQTENCVKSAGPRRQNGFVVDSCSMHGVLPSNTTDLLLRTSGILLGVENSMNLLTCPSLFRCLFPPDPVPAFKSWQDESEGGEAQLSPLAGRMVPLPPLPLEEEGEEDEKEGGQEASPSSSRSHPHLLARRFLDFGAHSSQRFLQQDPDATSPTKAQRYFVVG